MPLQTHVIDITEHSLLDDVRVSRLVDRIVITLITNLEDTLVFGRGIDHRLTLIGALRHHLFTQDMFTCVERADCDYFMRPERSCDVYGFEIFFLQHLLPVVVLIWLGPTLSHHHLDHRPASFRIHIAERFEIAELTLILVEQTVTHVACTDEGDLYRPAANRTTSQRRCAECHEGRRTGNCFPKVATSDLSLLFGKIHDEYFRLRNKSSPAILPVSNMSNTATAAASMSVLLTIRYVALLLGLGYSERRHVKQIEESQHHQAEPQSDSCEDTENQTQSDY